MNKTIQARWAKARNRLLDQIEEAGGVMVTHTGEGEARAVHYSLKGSGRSVGYRRLRRLFEDGKLEPHDSGLFPDAPQTYRPKERYEVAT